MFRRGQRRTGESAYAGPRYVGLAWSYETGYFVEASPAIGASDNVYIPSFDNNLYALTSTGSFMWSYDLSSWLFSSPAIDVDGRLYLGSDGGVFYAIDSAGTLAWSYETGATIDSSPLIDDSGHIYFGSEDNNIYSLSSGGSLRWSYETGYWVVSSPALDRTAGRIHVTSTDQRIYTLDTAGAFVWSYSIPNGGGADSCAVGTEGQVYTGTIDDDILYSFDSAGSLLWSYELSWYIISSPAVKSDGTVYAGDRNGMFYSLNSDGSLTWSFGSVGDAIRSNPAIGSDGIIYFGTHTNSLYALESDGTLLWSYETGDWIISSPAIGSSGRLYVGGRDNNIYCIQDRALAAPLALMKDNAGADQLFGYNAPDAGDWVYWDALARNPSPLARDFWIIPSGYNMVAMTEVDADDAGAQELALLKVDGVTDQNIYIYNAPAPGDWVYWDAVSRNPSALARDFWAICPGNDISLLADGEGRLASMKDQGGDYNLYLYNSPFPGDWTYWDCDSRNPSPLARDFWIISQGDDAVAMCGVDTTGDADSDSLLVVRNQSGTYTVYLWNMPVTGDWRYWDAAARNPSPRARDFWVIPQRDDIEDVVGISRGSIDDLGVMENQAGDYNFYVWNVPAPGDWVYWDCIARNPSPLARDFWLVPNGDNTVGMAAPR